MNNKFLSQITGSLTWCWMILGLVLPLSLKADGLQMAHITIIKNDVLISKGGGAERSAAINDVVRMQDSVTTGKKSHAELVFPDQSVARLGSNTVFSFDPKSREMSLQRGTAMIHVPPNLGGANISTPAATAAIHGDTIVVQALDTTANAANGDAVRFAALSTDPAGPTTITSTATGDTAYLTGGQYVTVDSAGTFSPVQDFNAATFVATCPLTQESKSSETPAAATNVAPTAAVDGAVTASGDAAAFAALPTTASAEIGQVLDVQGAALSSGMMVETVPVVSTATTATTTDSTTPTTSDTTVTASADTTMTGTTVDAGATAANTSSIATVDTSSIVSAPVMDTSLVSSMASDAIYSAPTAEIATGDATTAVTATQLCTPTDGTTCPPGQ